jgi:Fic family protein
LSEEKIDRIINLLEEILKWQKLQGLEKAQSAIKTLLTNDVEKLAYEFSDGKTSREVSAVVGVSHVTIANYWKKWAKYGIVTEIKAQGGGTRYRKIFSLSDFGIDVPKVEKKSEEGMELE